MHSATPQLEPALQSGLSTIIMAGRNLRSLPWHCSVFWAYTHPEIMARQTIKTDIGCPLKANMSSKLQLVVCCGRTRRFRWFLFRCALSKFEERDLWAEKAQPSPASAAVSASASATDRSFHQTLSPNCIVYRKITVYLCIETNLWLPFGKL